MISDSVRWSGHSYSSLTCPTQCSTKKTLVLQLQRSGNDKKVNENHIGNSQILRQERNTITN